MTNTTIQNTADTYTCPICGKEVKWSSTDDKLHFDVYNPSTHELLGTVCQSCYKSHTSTDITSKLKAKYNQPIEWDEYTDREV